MPVPNLDHPTLPLVKAAFSGVALQATEFRGQTTLIVPAGDLHAVMRYLRDDPACDCQPSLPVPVNTLCTFV